MKAFLPIIFLVIAGAVFFGYINSAYSSLSTLRKEAAEYDQALTRSKDLQSQRDELLARANAFPEADKNRLEKLIPDHIDNVRLILDLDAMAGRYAMRIKNVTIQSAAARSSRGQIGPDEKDYESVVLSFSVTGTYDTFRSFLADLERSLRLVDVVGLTFASQNEAGIYDYTVKVRTYWLKP